MRHPFKLEANQLSPMDVVRSVNDANVVLPAGDVQIGRYDYNIYANSMLKEQTTSRRRLLR
jgi:multidrug efflux pump subunit AcrB